MLDVHPPEHAPHGVRDFFLHIFTITIGLLIALGLEGAVEWRHHVHLRHEADENIRSEIRDNRQELAEVLSHMSEEKQMLLKTLEFLDARAKGKNYDLKSLNLGMSLGEYRDASFQTANTTGALSYMEYAHVKAYSAVYTLQTQVFQLQNQALAEFLAVQASIVGNNPDQMAPEDAIRARGDVQKAFANLTALDQVGHALEKQYDEVLKAE